MHNSKFTNDIKMKLVDLSIKEHDIKESSMKGSLSVRVDSGIQLGCSTNFKIEPQYFRGERNIESLEDRYIIEDIIGKGGFGEVKRIKDKTNNTFRALKIINKKSCQMTDDFADEIEIIKKLVILK